MNRGNSTIPVDEDWETGDEIDWRYYWSIINRRKWSIIGLALAVGLLTTLVVFAMTPIYRASTTLLIESQAPNVVSIQEVYGLDTRSQDYLATQIEIMGGRPIAETVVDGLGLIEQPAFRPQHLDWQSWLPGMQKKARPSRAQELSLVELSNALAAPSHSKRNKSGTAAAPVNHDVGANFCAFES